jgi:hypothetical protein
MPDNSFIPPLLENAMNLKTLIALAVAGAFAVPMAASAADDSLVIAQAGGTGSASGSAASGGAGDAGNRMEPHPRGFDRLDTNHDGYVSRDEASHANDLNTRFSEMDRDNDGKLSRQEYNAFEADQRAQGHGPGQQRTHRGAAGATREGDVNAGAAKAPNKQPSENPRSETDTTK